MCVDCVFCLPVLSLRDHRLLLPFPMECDVELPDPLLLKDLFNSTHLTTPMSASPVRLSALAPTPTVGVDASAAAPGKGLLSVKNQSAPLFPLFPWWLPPPHPSFLRRLQAAIYWTVDAPAWQTFRTSSPPRRLESVFTSDLPTAARPSYSYFRPHAADLNKARAASTFRIRTPSRVCHRSWAAERGL